VRRAIAPEAPWAYYAGYVVWRGLVEEQSLTRSVPRESDHGLWIEYVAGYRLVAAVLPGRNGSLEVGRRQITFAWFDVHREQLLRRSGCITSDGYVVGTLGRGAIDDGTRDDLSGLIARLWPANWAEAVRLGVGSKPALTGAPIAEYKPGRLFRGALAIVGDAAHAVSPMTGRGFVAGVEDASVLAKLLAERQAHEPVSAVLARYAAAA
jgi:2-polyprenyl-6-methoxyphenol hydroxylase-like FAD-dependent oxidoreductase